MKKVISKPDITLLSLALNVSKKAAVVATIKYSGVYLSNGDINVELLFATKEDDFQVLFDDVNSHWKFFIPLIRLTYVNTIEETIMTLLGVKPLEHQFDPIVSIPINYFRELAQKGCLCLDCFFTPACCEKAVNFKFISKKGIYFLEIFVDGNICSSQKVFLCLRNGKGNEDL